MMTVSEVNRLTGVSVRTLRYYDRIGLLPPAAVTEAGYRLYDGASLERLQQILLFRELEFPLKEIKRILDRPDFDRDRALGQQIELLRLRRQQLDKLISLAREIQKTGGNIMNFQAFDKTQIEDYARRARESWGDTQAYREFEEKHGKRTAEEEKSVNDRLMDYFREFGRLKAGEPESPAAQAQVAALRAFITENFYNCTPEILSGLGQMYAAEGEFKENIDRAAGPGAAQFAADAIEIYCKSAK